jgi:hypothetical protein
MTAHNREFANLRVGATVTLRDWQGDTIKGIAFLSPTGAWLMRTGSGAVFPVLPRELIAVKDGAAETFAKLQDGARVTLADWQGGTVKGAAREMSPGVWECKDASGARWLIEPYRLVSIEEG